MEYRLLWDHLSPIRETRWPLLEQQSPCFSWDMVHLRRLMESRPFFDRIPFNQIVLNDYMPETEFITATRGKDYILVYFPTGKEATLDLNLCGWPKARLYWFNCQTGEVSEIGVDQTNQILKISPATRLRGNDWVLIMDNTKVDFSVPGGKYSEN